jgi:N-acyl-phosphatidylethanolamine-hydrolysing phospholipase D
MIPDNTIKTAIDNKTERLIALPHWSKGRFFNPYQKDSKRKLWHVFLWQIGYYNDPKPLAPFPIDFSYPQTHITPTSKSTVQWINHSTFLIRHNGINCLTDPIWSRRASPVRFVGPKRKFQPAISLKNLPPLHFVFISHDHYDHLDVRAIKFLSQHHPQAVFCVPLGLKKWFEKRGVTRLIELDWWQEVSIPVNIPAVDGAASGSEFMKITAVPAQHFSGRKLLGKDKTLWCGWVIEFISITEKPKKFYFVGDTGYNEFDFRKIGEIFEHIDLSIIPIGSYIPKRFMAPVHIGPDEACKIHQEAKSKLSIASHFGTFRLSEEHHKRPPFDLYKALEKESIPHDDFIVPLPGQLYYW